MNRRQTRRPDDDRTDTFTAMIAKVADLDSCLERLRRLVAKLSNIAPAAVPHIRAAMASIEKARQTMSRAPAE